MGLPKKRRRSFPLSPLGPLRHNPGIPPAPERRHRPPAGVTPLGAPYLVCTETRRTAVEIIDGVPRTLPRDDGPVEVEVVTGVERPAFYDRLIECLAR